jgi:hypothetical protein
MFLQMYRLLWHFNDLLYIQEWEDDRINWTPSAKDDIEEIFSKPADIWKPELVVDNSYVHTH